jgi:acetyltransferase-like isoleucine patch superfamily enzyme
MYFLKTFNILRLFLLKLRLRKRLEIKSLSQGFYWDTEIAVAKNAKLSLKGFGSKSNVHLICDAGEMQIGRGVFFNRNCIVACRYKISIGDNCLFGPNVCIYDHDHVYTANGVLPYEFSGSEIIIEDGCWLGAGAIILRGTHIGKNSIIEAGAVVRGDVPPNTLVTIVKETRMIPTALFASKRENDIKQSNIIKQYIELEG